MDMRFLKEKYFYQAAITGLLVVLLATYGLGISFYKEVSLTPIFYLQVIVLFPVLEEYIFRGWFQQSLLIYLPRSLMGIGYANIVVSGVFVGCHLFYTSNTLILIGIFCSSLVFGFLFDQYRRVLPSMVLHSFYNLIFIVFMV